MAESSSTPSHELRVHAYFRRVKDFERRENGDPIVQSLKGPDRIEARQQLTRERLVAGAEMKILHEALRMCYHREGVNHYENCKDLVEKVVAKQRASYWGALGAPSRTY